MLDKFKIQGSLVFNKQMDGFIGFTDFGDSGTNYITFSDLGKLASHILVYYVRGFVLTSSFHFQVFRHMVLCLSR